MKNMFIIVQLLYGTWGGRKGKENDRVNISKYITSVQVEHMIIFLESW
jgi:hypothetical protein